MDLNKEEIILIDDLLNLLGCNQCACDHGCNQTAIRIASKYMTREGTTIILDLDKKLKNG